MREPGVELGEGGGVQLVSLEGAFCVLVGLGGGVGAGGGDWEGGLAGSGGRVGEALRTNELGVGGSCHVSIFEEAYRRESHGEGPGGVSIVLSNVVHRYLKMYKVHRRIRLVIDTKASQTLRLSVSGKAFSIRHKSSRGIEAGYLYIYQSLYRLKGYII